MDSLLGESIKPSPVCMLSALLKLQHIEEAARYRYSDHGAYRCLLLFLAVCITHEMCHAVRYFIVSACYRNLAKLRTSRLRLSIPQYLYGTITITCESLKNPILAFLIEQETFSRAEQAGSLSRRSSAVRPADNTYQ